MPLNFAPDSSYRPLRPDNIQAIANPLYSVRSFRIFPIAGVTKQYRSSDERMVSRRILLSTVGVTGLAAPAGCTSPTPQPVTGDGTSTPLTGSNWQGRDATDVETDRHRSHVTIPDAAVLAVGTIVQPVRYPHPSSASPSTSIGVGGSSVAPGRSPSWVRQDAPGVTTRSPSLAET